MLLAFDTATPLVTVALHDGDDVAWEGVSERTLQHGEQLAPLIDRALRETGLVRQDLTAVGVGVGPGPFTGLRVGMATAAAYGHALGIPVYGVCSLDAIGLETTGDVLVVTDARRREVYWALYRNGLRVGGPAVSAPADVPPGAGAVAGSPEHAALFDLPRLEPVYPAASALVRVVADWSADPDPLVPLYLRRPDAKPQAELARTAR